MFKSHYHIIAKNQDKHWWYKGMANINTTLLGIYLRKRKGLKILDAGCGPGAMLPHLKKYGDVIGIDLSDEALKYAKKRGVAKKGDITNLKFKNETFDLVICMDVLYHVWVKDIDQAIGGFNRVLKKGGILLIREPAYNWMRGNEDRGGLTARRFSQSALRENLENNSFEVKKITYANFFLFPAVLAIRLITMFGLKKGSSDISIPSQPINSILFSILNFESILMKYVSLPFGSSLICVSRKK